VAGAGISARIRLGTAGWSIPRAAADACPGDGTHLARYARVFNAAEINSSFHRPHAPATYARWAGCTPRSFRFAVKLPRTITHERQLRRARAPLTQFLDESAGLGTRRGPLLVQLPPSFGFDDRVVGRFLDLLRRLFEGDVVCEPRHPTWFEGRADAVLERYRVARVAADPAPASGAERPGGWTGIIYCRLHGSPRKYWSRYSADFIASLVADLQSAPRTSQLWCIFDNTASGAALENALEVKRMLHAAKWRARGDRTRPLPERWTPDP
jgi:uncharacterized protein YecE (DUF72 family)